MINRRFKVGVAPREESTRLRKLLAALAEVFPVEFVPCDHDGAAGIDGLILTQSPETVALNAARAGVPCFSVLNGQNGTKPCADCEHAFRCITGADGKKQGIFTAPGELRFFSCADDVFHREGIQDSSVTTVCPLSAAENTEVLASKTDCSLWTRLPAGRATVDFVARSPIELPSGRFLFDEAADSQFMTLFPLFVFLRKITREGLWRAPAMRASIIVDDPNLRLKCYGFIDYAQLAQHARRHHYHVAFATVPADLWWVGAEAVRLFRENADVLSLLIHGNNHTDRELAQRETEGSLQANLAQALRRVAVFEERSQLPIARVMSPPHGECSETAMRCLSRLGFEAICVSPYNLWKQNPLDKRAQQSGFIPAEFLCDNFPAIPRMAFARQWQKELLLAGVFGRPHVVMMHHWDFANGLEILSDISARINSLGSVEWMNMAHLTESNYLQRIQGDAMNVKMFTRTASIRIPPGVRTISIQRPWLRNEDIEQLRLQTQNGQHQKIKHYAGGPIHVGAVSEIAVSAAAPETTNLQTIPLPSWRFWPFTRRLLVEGRDRMMPLWPRRFR